jgi:hypothetical protein
MAPDSADVEMEGACSNPFSDSATSRKSYWHGNFNMNSIIPTEQGAVNRPADQEDEDTEQKIINEGSCRLQSG